MISNRLYEHGYRSLTDVRNMMNKENSFNIDVDNERFKYGLSYYEDLNRQLSFADAMRIFEIVKKISLEIDKNCILDVVGGFRRLGLYFVGFLLIFFLLRGKAFGHDLDILVTHPVSGEEKGLLVKILDGLS